MAYTIKANLRTETGKGPMRRLRRAGQIPAVMYGHGDPSLMLTLSAKEFNRVLESIKGHSPIVELEIDGRVEKCVIKTLQRNPITGALLHVDFQKVHPEEKITMTVPVVLHGVAEGVKAGGMLDHLLRGIPVRATIDRIPERFDIDVTKLGLGQSIHVADLKREGIEFAIPEDTAIVTILVPRKLAAAQMEAAAATAAAAPAAEQAKEPEVIKQKAEKEAAPEEAKEGKKTEKKEKK